MGLLGAVLAPVVTELAAGRVELECASRLMDGEGTGTGLGHSEGPGLLAFLLVSGELPQLYFPLGAVAMAGKGLGNKGRVCGALHGAGLYKQSLSLHVNVIGIQTRAPELWTVAAAGQVLVAALQRGVGRRDGSPILFWLRERRLWREF